METSDTVNLLKECDAGTKMAVSSIDELIDEVENPKFKNILVECRDKHTKIGNKLHKILLQQDQKDKDPNPIAKGMSWVKTNLKMKMHEDDTTVADLITDGCNMGVKSLNRYLNQYSKADETAKSICKELIDLEEKLAVDVRCYL
ncbi:hypothetical protein [Anaerotignum sp.]|uniref:hypothetical protein n=1 Tax=Anaerotignum sp. TaxID=2039241 RepID=UPI0028AAEB5D|nr:hypothetical protein [Anaerotignum sp.]